MEFYEKLQELRKRKGLTQEELSEYLYVSRTAISKWESGRGYPNIDSLKMIARFFSVTVDELLSPDELLSGTQETQTEKVPRFYDLAYGLLDVSMAMLLFLPVFGEKTADMVRTASLLFLTSTALWLQHIYFLITIATAAVGIFQLAFHTRRDSSWGKMHNTISLGCSTTALLLLILGRQPYAAVFVLVLLAAKVALLLKRR